MIEVKEFSFCYPGENTLALDDISLTIDDGETVLVVGPSGCGKSTLLLAMNGVVPSLTGGKVKGKVFVDGLDTGTTPVASLAARVGLILQDPESQLTNLYVYDEVAFGPENLGLPEDEIVDRADNALKKSGLYELKDRSVFALSGGQKQRVAIAASLAMKPKTILMDNPTSNLDPVGAAETYGAIRKLREDDPEKTIILADHRPDHIMPIVDRIVVMDQGKIVGDGRPREVFSRQGEYLKNELGIFLPQIVDLFLQIKKKGYPIQELPLQQSEALEVISSLDLQIVDQEAPMVSEANCSDRETEKVLELDKVKFSYPNQLCAIDGVTLDIDRGEFLCLVGQNGSGKTTLAKLMVGLLEPKEGSVQFFGEDIRNVPLSDLIGRMGYVFQYPEHQFVSNNVFDEIAFSLRALGMDEKEVRQRTEEMLEKFSLKGVRKSSPLLLSKGQKRRLSVATMLITKPDVLILDEPMTGQDQKNIINLLAILNELRSGGTTIIDITHDMEHVASSYADRVVGLASGHVVFDGISRDLFLDKKALDQLSLEPPPVVRLAEALRGMGVMIPEEVNTITQMIQVI